MVAAGLVVMMAAEVTIEAEALEAKAAEGLRRGPAAVRMAVEGTGWPLSCLPRPRTAPRTTRDRFRGRSRAHSSRAGPGRADRRRPPRAAARGQLPPGCCVAVLWRYRHRRQRLHLSLVPTRKEAARPPERAQCRACSVERSGSRLERRASPRPPRRHLSSSAPHRASRAGRCGCEA